MLALSTVDTLLRRPEPPVTVVDIVERVENLVSLPDAVMRLNVLLSEPDSTLDEIAEVLMLDPGLSARVLRAVNSAYFGLPMRIDHIGKAVTMLGTGELHTIVLATSAASAFRRIPSKLVDMEAFWQHSVRAALAARSLAGRCLRRQRERVFMGALLHDVGQLVACHQLPDATRRVLEAVQSGAERVAAEQEVLGFTHAELGAALLERWCLPASLVEPVRWHHASERALVYPAETALVHLGNAIAHHMDRARLSGRECGPDVTETVWRQAGATPDDVEDVMLEVSLNWMQVIEIIAPDSTMIF